MDNNKKPNAAVSDSLPFNPQMRKMASRLAFFCRCSLDGKSRDKAEIAYAEIPLAMKVILHVGESNRGFAERHLDKNESVSAIKLGLERQRNGAMDAIDVPLKKAWDTMMGNRDFLKGLQSAIDRTTMGEWARPDHKGLANAIKSASSPNP